MTKDTEGLREHRCGRCNEKFRCQHGSACKAGEVVMPNIIQSDGSIREHCPLRPDWDWIRAYGDRRRAEGHIEAVRVYGREAGRLEAQTWQPIATAPASEEVLVAVEKARYLSYQTDQPAPMVNTWRHANGEQLPGWPTHWMPLPPPPSAPEE